MASHPQLFLIPYWLCPYKEKLLNMFLLLLFEAGSHIAQGGLKLVIWLRMTLNFYPSCLHFLSAVLIGIPPHGWFGNKPRIWVC